MAIRLIHLICDGCQAVVNKIEYDADGRRNKVDQVASTLGISADDAETYVDAHNADPAAQAAQLAGTLANPADSPCPTGCAATVKVVTP